MAQDLRRGHVVYWTGADWSRRLDEALVAHDDDAARALDALAARANAGTEVIDAFLFALATEGELPRRPVRYREAQRLCGPSIAYGAAVTG